MRLYERLARDLETLIREGTLRVVTRAPSIRQLCRERATSAASVERAYELLEARGLMESRARSGFFITGPRSAHKRSSQTPRPEHVDVSQLVFQILEGTRARTNVPLGSAFPSPELFPLQQLGRHLGYVESAAQPVEHRRAPTSRKPRAAQPDCPTLPAAGGGGVTRRNHRDCRSPRSAQSGTPGRHGAE